MKVLFCPTDSQNSVSVISIVGIGGLGKTTLAQLLLDDEEVKTQFELKLWVCVAESFEIKAIVQKILESIEEKKPDDLEMNSLKNQLRRTINRKRYILILDDVWNEDPKKWLDLMDLLVGGANGSKIIITTRHRKVAITARSVLVHSLKGLSDDESWDLFKKLAFVDGEVPDSSFEEIGKEIVRKFNGVPLVLKTIGGLLYSKKFEDEWRSFKDGELSTLTQLEDNGILPILRLSYNHLPSHLKQCFAYCRLFPKDYRINVETLVELWIAQGFVQTSNETQKLKNIGLQYFKELLWRSFFQEDDFGNACYYKMHDLMHDLATSIAGGEVISLSSNDSSIGEKTRHVSIDFKSSFTRKDLLSLSNASKARTFLLVNKSEFKEDESIGKEECHLILSNLKLLRALDLHALRIETMSHSISKLELLTYLDLSGNNRMKKLPNSICRLLNLQVLKFDWCKSLEELPKDIRKLVKLRCLSMIHCYGLTHMPRGIGQLTCLETLSDFIVDKEGHGAELSELKNLKNLRGRLCIRNLGNVKYLKFELQALNINESQHLQQLELDWISSAEDNTENAEMTMDVLQPHQNLKELKLSYYKGTKFSSWLSSLTNLVELNLCNCKNIQSLPPFDQFPSLKELWLVGLTNLEYVEIGISSNNGDLPLFFPSLKFLIVFDCPNLKGWVRCSGTVFPNFHCLSYLSIRCCPNLNSMPPFPSIDNLKFKGKSMKQLEQLLKPNISVAQHNSSSPLPQLEKMTITGIEEEAVLAGELQQKLTSLTTLSIDCCPGLVGMESSPFGLSGLSKLEFCWMNEMESLPKWLQRLSNLNHLQFRCCLNLASLPEWMSGLTSLQHLVIDNCPKLSERCKNINGEDWPKIAHIPNIVIDGLRVQQNGYLLHQ